MINKQKTKIGSVDISQKVLQLAASITKNKKQQIKNDFIQLNDQSEKEAQELFNSIPHTDQLKDEDSSHLKQEEQEEQEKQEQQQSQEESQKQSEKDISNIQQKHKNQSQKMLGDSSFQNKIKSILKSKYQSKQSLQKKKKVSFIQGQKKNNQQYIGIGNERKWNQKLKNPRKGKFDPQQKRSLIRSLSRCLTLQNLSYDDVVKALSQQDDKIPRNLNFWTKVCSILPDRTLISSYKFLKRQLSSKNKGGDWTQNEVNILEQLVNKYGRKWSMIAKQMNRTAENVRDKFRIMRQQKQDLNNQQVIWKFQQIFKFLKYLQKYSKIDFLNEQFQKQLQSAQKHDQIQIKQLKQRKYNSKTFIFHNNQIARKYISKQFNGIKIEEVNWQKISDKIETKTIFDCRNKFIQLLQLQIYGLGSKQYFQKLIAKFICNQNVRSQNDINWSRWKHQDIQMEQAKNRWMILKRHIQGRGQKTFKQLVDQLKNKFNIN